MHKYKICIDSMLMVCNMSLLINFRCSAEDLKYFVRLLKHDLRIFAGPKHV